MAVTLTTAARNAACNAIVDLIDVGTTDANGDLLIATSGDVEVATLACSNPAFGAAATGVATAAAISDDTNATGGTAAIFWFQDRDNTEVFRGSVGTSGADLNLSSVVIGSGDTVSVSAFTATMPAS
jgi:hypothetical protein